jgi:pimeloyl-ACP methyl ester carboxylesterase
MTNNLVTSRRAYFDCRYGQLHVRTAFPGTGGFDEHTTVVCVHSEASTSRAFVPLLAQLAQNRSVYAPDLPGHGESDSNAAAGAETAALRGAHAVADLARDLRLKQIDLLALDDGAEIAMMLAGIRTDLVRRLVLLGRFAAQQPVTLKQPCLPLPIASDALQTSWPQVIGKMRPFFDSR